MRNPVLIWVLTCCSFLSQAQRLKPNYRIVILNKNYQAITLTYHGYKAEEFEVIYGKSDQNRVSSTKGIACTALEISDVVAFKVLFKQDTFKVTIPNRFISDEPVLVQVEIKKDKSCYNYQLSQECVVYISSPKKEDCSSVSARHIRLFFAGKRPRTGYQCLDELLKDTFPRSSFNLFKPIRRKAISAE